MKSVVKKVAIYSMAGIMQFGLGGAALAASPAEDSPATQQQYIEDSRPEAENGQVNFQGDQVNHEEDQSNLENQADSDKTQAQKEREHLENERYKKAIQRKPNESDAEWQKRLQKENERREQNLEQIKQER